MLLFLFEYFASFGEIEFIWSLPMLKQHIPFVPNRNNIPPPSNQSTILTIHTANDKKHIFLSVLISTGKERTANVSQPVQTFWLPDYSTLLCFLQILFTWARSGDGTLESLYSDFLLLSVKTTETSSTFACSQRLIRDRRLWVYWLTYQKEKKKKKGKQDLHFSLFNSSKNKGNVKKLDT